MSTNELSIVARDLMEVRFMPEWREAEIMAHAIEQGIILYRGGAFDLIDFNAAIAKVFEDVHAAVQPFPGERALSNHRYTSTNQLSSSADHVGEAAEWHLCVITEQPHGQVADLVTSFQQCLIRYGSVIRVRLILHQPQGTAPQSSILI